MGRVSDSRPSIRQIGELPPVVRGAFPAASSGIVRYCNRDANEWQVVSLAGIDTARSFGIVSQSLNCFIDQLRNRVAAERSIAVPPQPAAAPTCDQHEHVGGAAAVDVAACERAAAIFAALGDPQRLRILIMLEDSERCVSELCHSLQENMSSISQRLRLLKAERIVRSRRDGKHVYYALADNHIARLVTNGLLHALERPGGRDELDDE